MLLCKNIWRLEITFGLFGSQVVLVGANYALNRLYRYL